MKASFVLFAMILFVRTLSFEQQTMLEVDPRRKVPGENHVYYCSANHDQDLFHPQELTIMPDPIETNRHFFIYLYGHTFIHDPTLVNATLTFNFTADKPGMGNVSATTKLTDFPNVITRVHHKYGVPLQWGPNEMIADAVVLSWPGFQTGNYTAVAEARMPDGRRLFCFVAELYLEGDGGW